MESDRSRRSAFVGLAGLLVAATVHASPVKLHPAGLLPGDNFGQAVAVSGDTVIVSAHQDDAGAGSVYVFREIAGVWSLEQRLLADDREADDLFGTFIAIDADTVVVGAPGKAGAAGSAYVFSRTGTNWSQQAKIVAGDGASNDRFGTSVAISGERVIIGAPGHDSGGEDRGAAYTFVRSGTVWSPQQKILAPDADDQDRFGSDVALDGDTAIVSAPLDDEAGENSGAAYAFVEAASVWTFEQKLLATDSIGGELVGTAVALSGDTAVLGAHYGFTNGTVNGAAYVFTRVDGTWSEAQKLTAFDGSGHDDFGWAVGVVGDIAIGGGDADEGASGSAHLYVRRDATWYHQREFSLPSRGGNFGYSVAASSQRAVVGAPNIETQAGAAYVYDIDSVLAHPVAGSRLTIRNRSPDNEARNLITVTLEDSELWRPVPGSSTDPTVAGVIVRVESTASGEVFEQLLPAQNWVARGTEQAKVKYRYRDRNLESGPCKDATIDGRRVKLTCSGKGPTALDYDLTAGQSQVPVRVTLQFAPGVGYCAEFGGSIGRDGSDATAFRGKHAPAPDDCD